jgi:2-polyprenyl-3-methyl-5-hydroxy-6-metoxy-1,4-benzoquinol methylase
MLEQYLRTNLAWWDEAVGVHVGTDLYDVEGFRRGGDSLTAIERDELAPLVDERTRLLHLQCHFGLDTLSWARRGATVTGVDFSGKAVEQARRLADEVGLSRRATFVQSSVCDLPQVLDGQFDVVFSSWGVLIWLDDLERWADVVARYVRPGGVFYLAEFHPVLFLIDDGARSADLRLTYPYFQGREPLRFDEPGSYADPEAKTDNTVTFEWQHGLAEVLTPLLQRGLRLDHLHEFPCTRGLDMPFLERGDDGWQRVKGGRDDIPLSFTLKMTKEES